MSRNQRIGLLVAALAVVVAAVVIATAGGSDDSEDRGQRATVQAETSETESEQTDTEQVETEAPAEGPSVTRIELRGGSVVGGLKTIEVVKGQNVRIVVTSDAADDIHLHGYDIERQVGPGQPGNFRFEANLEGVFEMESHTAEDAGKDPRVAELTVNPS
jgi:FtsP/CotA-like multicopper oxidase with cupredoxin domain